MVRRIADGHDMAKGRELVRLRKASGLFQEQLAALLGISPKETDGMAGPDHGVGGYAELRKKYVDNAAPDKITLSYIMTCFAALRPLYRHEP
jgi:hypothetical protein